jgi:CRP-like cAMP-binding protein
MDNIVHKIHVVNEKNIMAQLNEPTQKYISIRGCQALITKVPFFRDLDQNLITQILLILEVEYYTTSDFIIEEGTQGDKMYFIAHGKVEVVVGGVSKARMNSGQFFGEIALLMGSTKRTASIRAVSNCVLYSLSRKNLDVVLEGNHGLARKLKQVAEERLNSDKQRMAAAQPMPNTTAIIPPVIIQPVSSPASAARPSIAVSTGDMSSYSKRPSLVSGSRKFVSVVSSVSPNIQDTDAVSVVSVRTKDHLGRSQSYLNFLDGDMEIDPSIHGIELEEVKEPGEAVEINILTTPPSPKLAAQLETEELNTIGMLPVFLPDIQSNLPNIQRTHVDERGRKRSVIQYPRAAHTISAITKKVETDFFGRQTSILEYHPEGAIENTSHPLLTDLLQDDSSFVRYEIDALAANDFVEGNLTSELFSSTLTPRGVEVDNPITTNWRANALRVLLIDQELSEALGSDFSIHPPNSIQLAREYSNQSVPSREYSVRSREYSVRKSLYESTTPVTPRSRSRSNSLVKQTPMSPRENKSAFVLPIMQENSDSDKRSIASDVQ